MKLTKEQIKNAMLMYAVTDRAWVGRQTLLEQIEDALKGGATCIQLREKELSDEDFLAEAIEVRKLCTKYNVPFVVNDNVEVAVKSKADGIHVGQSDMEAGLVRQKVGPDVFIGVSAATVEQAVQAQTAGADCIGVGAVFPTATKADAADVPFDELKSICAAVDIPVVAIGGISKKNISDLKGSGIDGVALVSAVFAAENIESEVRALLTLSKDMVNG